MWNDCIKPDILMLSELRFRVRLEWWSFSLDIIHNTLGSRVLSTFCARQLVLRVLSLHYELSMFTLDFEKWKGQSIVQFRDVLSQWCRTPSLKNSLIIPSPDNKDDVLPRKLTSFDTWNWVFFQEASSFRANSWAVWPIPQSVWRKSAC